jgi:hypothetical protein
MRRAGTAVIAAAILSSAWIWRYGASEAAPGQTLPAGVSTPEASDATRSGPVSVDFQNVHFHVAPGVVMEGAPLGHIDTLIDDVHLKQKGTLHKGVPIRSRWWPTCRLPPTAGCACDRSR